MTSLSSLPPLTCWQTENETPRHYIYSNNTVRLYLQYYEHHLFVNYIQVYYTVHTTRFTACSFVWKWKSQLLTLSDQNFMTDRPVSESESDFVRPKFWQRSVGHKIFTLTPTRPFSHERTGREPRTVVRRSAFRYFFNQSSRVFVTRRFPRWRCACPLTDRTLYKWSHFKVQHTYSYLVRHIYKSASRVGLSQSSYE